jgi:hypothetical protein
MPSDAEPDAVDNDFKLPSSPLSHSQSQLESIQHSRAGERDNDGIDDNQVRDDEAAAASPTTPLGKDLEPEFGKNSPTVSVEFHAEGEPVYMSGAVSLEDTVEDDLGVLDNDNIDCDFRLVFDQMPYKVMRCRELYSLGLPPDADALLDLLPAQFVTTHLGIQRAWEQWTAWTHNAEKREADGEDDPTDPALVLIQQIVYRGGLPPISGQQVIYPEDIIPLEHLRADGAGGWEWNGRTEVYDPAYWLELRMQGEIWDEMPEIPTFA